MSVRVKSRFPKTKRVACFWIWAGTNATWAAVDLHHGLPAQAALQTIYFALSIYGIWAWRPR